MALTPSTDSSLSVTRTEAPRIPARIPEADSTIRRWWVPSGRERRDAGMDRLVGAPEALEFVRRFAFPAPDAAFDAAFSTR